VQEKTTEVEEKIRHPLSRVTKKKKRSTTFTEEGPSVRKRGRNEKKALKEGEGKRGLWPAIFGTIRHLKNGKGGRGGERSTARQGREKDRTLKLRRRERQKDVKFDREWPRSTASSYSRVRRERALLVKVPRTRESGGSGTTPEKEKAEGQRKSSRAWKTTLESWVFSQKEKKVPGHKAREKRKEEEKNCLKEKTKFKGENPKKLITCSGERGKDARA